MRTPLRLAASVLFIAAFALTFSGCGQPSQIGSSEEVFNTVDALYTAVTAKRVDLLDQCYARLEEMHRKGELSPPAFEELKAICDTARNNEWQSAAETLYDFMRGQRKGT